jgi:hypothetical protein
MPGYDDYADNVLNDYLNEKQSDYLDKVKDQQFNDYQKGIQYLADNDPDQLTAMSKTGSGMGDVKAADPIPVDRGLVDILSKGRGVPSEGGPLPSNVLASNDDSTDVDAIRGLNSDDRTPTAPGSSTGLGRNAVPIPRGPAVLSPGMVPPALPSAPSQSQPSVKDYIASRLASENDGLKEAQAKAQENRGIADVTEGLGQAFSGLSRSHTFDPASYAYLHKQADQPVTDFMQQQKQKSDVMNQVALENKIKRDQLYDDPNSVASKMAQGLTGRMLEKIGMDPSAVQGMSANDLTELQKTLKDMHDRSSMEKVIQLKQQELELKRKELKETQDTKYDESFKGSLQKIKPYTQADATSSGADALADTVNNATKNQASAAALPTELANFASRGQRLHQQTIEAFASPNSALMSRIKMGISKSANGTIPTDVAQDIIQFLNNEKASAETQKQAVIKQEAEGFKRVHGRYPKVYDPSLDTSSTANLSPQDQKAIQWAKNNPNDKRSKQILALHGM